MGECVFVNILFNSWFTGLALITAVRAKHIHLIGMFKIVKAKFLHQGKLMNDRQIKNADKHRNLSA
jgi:hypothetical protein